VVCLVREIIVIITDTVHMYLQPDCAGLYGIPIYINSVLGLQTAHTVLCTKILSYLDWSLSNVMYYAGKYLGFTLHHWGKTRRYGDDRLSAMRLVVLSADIRTDTAVFREDKVTLVKNILTGLTK